MIKSIEHAKKSKYISYKRIVTEEKKEDKMKKASDFVGRNMAWIVLIIAAAALFVPGTSLWIQTKWINYLLMLVMFGMGLTTKLSDFAIVFQRPRDIIIGWAAQFIIMPLLAFVLGKAFNLNDELLVGVVPIGLGVLVNRMFGKYTQRIRDSLPLVSVTAICLIVASVVSHNSAKILSTGAIIVVVVILHNLIGYLLGYLIGVLFKMDLPRKKAVAIEIGMQNSGLATTLAGSAFPNLTMATVPGAIFSVWHNISGAILAGWFNRKS